MKSILVLGPGCRKCNQLKSNVDEAVKQLSLAATVEHIVDVRKLMEFDVLMTPAMIIDGEVAVVGRVPSVMELQMLLSRHNGK